MRLVHVEAGKNTKNAVAPIEHLQRTSIPKWAIIHLL